MSLQLAEQFEANEQYEQALEEYKKYGVDYLQWITNIDGKECDICRDRHKKIYRVRELPGKPHIGCRCKGVPVK